MKITTIILTTLLSFSFVSALDVGARGKEVVELQKLLNSKGYKLPVTGYYGNLTKNAHTKYLKSILKATTTLTKATRTDIYIGVFKILSPLSINGFYQEVVSASFNGEEGVYNRRTDSFTSNKSIEKQNKDLQESYAKINTQLEDQRKKEEEEKSKWFSIVEFEVSKGIYARDDKGFSHKVICVEAMEHPANLETNLKELLDKEDFYGQFGNNKVVPLDNSARWGTMVVKCGVVNNVNGVRSYLIKDK